MVSLSFPKLSNEVDWMGPLLFYFGQLNEQRLNIDGQYLISTHTEVSFTFSILIDNKHRSSFGWLALLVSDKPIVR